MTGVDLTGVVRILDGYLSRKAQRAHPGALVYREEDGRYTLERPGLELVGLGDSFGRAQQTLAVLVRATLDHPEREES